MNYLVAPDPNDVRNGDVCIRTKKGRLVALIYARTPPQADMEVAELVCTALNAAFSSSSGETSLGPIPEVETFAITPPEGDNVSLEGGARFAHERDVRRLMGWARKAEAALASVEL